jgi:hypothetical protein
VWAIQAAAEQTETTAEETAARVVLLLGTAEKTAVRFVLLIESAGRLPPVLFC